MENRFSNRPSLALWRHCEEPIGRRGNLGCNKFHASWIAALPLVARNDDGGA